MKAISNKLKLLFASVDSGRCPAVGNPPETNRRHGWPVGLLQKVVGLFFVLCLGVGMNTALAVDTNILYNSGFELGQAGWNGAVRGGTALVITNAGVAHSGAAYISNYNVGGWSSCNQGGSNNNNVAAWNTGVSLPVSDAKFYQLSAWVKVPGASVTPADITLRYRFEPSGNRVDVGQQSISTEGWTQLQSGWISPGVGDTYVGYYEVHSVANAVVFYADDCAMTQSDGYAVTGVVQGTNGSPVVGATVQLKLSGNVIKTTTSGVGGAYTLAVQPVVGDVYEVNASKVNFQSPATGVSVTSAVAGTVAAPIVLTNIPVGIVSGTVTNVTTGLPVAGATVLIRGDAGNLTTTADGSGNYSIQVASELGYFISASKFPLSSSAQVVTPVADTTVTVNIGLEDSLLVAVYSRDLTNLANNASVNSWTNRGTLAGKFVPAPGVASSPTYVQQGLYKAANFKSTPMILTNDSGVIPAPGTITGNSANYTVSAWLYDGALPSEQSYISWAKRGGPDGTCAQINYSVNGSYGAVTHWGAPDMGFASAPTSGTWHNVAVVWNSATGVETLYVDGVLDKNSPVKTLDIGAGMPVILGAGYWNADGTAQDVQLGQFNVSGAFLAQVEVYGSAATAADVFKLSTNAPPAFPVGTVAVKVVTSDASSSQNFNVTVTTGSSSVAAAGTTDVNGNYATAVPPATYTVKVSKAGYVITPGTQSAVVANGTTNVLGNFTASPASISGVLVDAANGLPIYNGIVQVGGAGGAAVVTGTNGTFSFSAAGGAGGVEVFADALGYHCTNLLVTSSGGLYKKIALVAQTETGSVTNGGFESVAGDPLTPTGWTENSWSPGSLIYSSSTNKYSGNYSVFVSATGGYAPLSQYLQLTPGSVYNCYFKAKADTNNHLWFPMFSYRDSGDGEIKGWISGEAGYSEYIHAPPLQWMQYLNFKTYSGDSTQPFVRIAPPAGATVIAATFCWDTAPDTGTGVYVDDVVMDAVPASVPLVSTTPDPIVVSIQNAGSNLQLTWPVGSLLESTNVTGPWTTNLTATSPYTVTNSGVGNKFFKVLVQ